MTKQEKLRELLKTVPAIKEDLEQLRFGCEADVYVPNDGSNGYHKERHKITDYSENAFDGKYYYTFLYLVGLYTEEEIIDIIGNPLEERYLRMYCDNKNIEIEIDRHGYVMLDDGQEHNTYIGLNETKPFYLQDEKVYEDIFNFLNK